MNRTSNISSPYVGPYDELYRRSPEHIIWGEKPGRLVRRIHEWLPGGRILDAGCGDGKNAFFLEQHGYDVVGIDISSLAIDGLFHRFQRAGHAPNGTYLVQDVRHIELSGTFDAVVAYGLYHCLSVEDRLSVHTSLASLLNPDGLMLFSCLLDSMSMPAHHGTLGINPLSHTDVEHLFSGWNIRYREEGVITEEHLPIIGTHRHATLWIVAQRSR